MPVELRPYQNEIVFGVRKRMQSGIRSILVTAPTGSGKTLLTAHMLGVAATKGIASWFVCHRRELVLQSIRTFADVGISYGVEAAGFPADRRQLIQIASIQTLARRYTRLRRPGLIIWDEAHHIAARSWAAIHAAFPDAYHIGLTATPERLDGAGLSQWFQEMICGPSVSDLIEQEFLSPYRLYAPSNVNLRGVHTRMGDFITSEAAAVMDRPTITGDAIREYQRRANGKRAVVFCVSVAHSKHVAEQFNAAGIVAAHVDGETDTLTRDATVAAFQAGQVRVLTNVELFGEGFDLPALEVAILLRPTQSKALYLQQVGRALRPSPGKTEALILDHVGNCERHGLPDEPHEWSIHGRDLKKRREEDPTPCVRICPKCFAAQFIAQRTCKFCGTAFEIKDREVEQVEGELSEVDVAQIRRDRHREQARAQTLDDLIKIGKSRGYKHPLLWAQHVMHARRNRKPAGRVA